MSTKSKFVGVWKNDTSDKFDEYMKAVGVNFALRKMASIAKPTQEISQEGEDWKIKSVTTFKTTEICFKLGQEFDETTGDGRKMKTTVSLQDDGNKMVMSQLGEVPSTQTREIKDDDTMVMTLEAKDVVCTRSYKRVPAPST